MADSPAAELALDEDEIRALLRGQEDSARLAGLPLRKVAEGWDNAIWRLGDELAVRLPRRALASSLIRHEQRALPVLGPRLAVLGIRTPVPLIVGAPTEAFPWPWSVVPWIDGTPALGLSMQANAPWAPMLAAALGALHRPAPADAPGNPVRGVALAERDEAMRARLVRLGDAQPMQSAWDAGLTASSASEKVWIHGDLHPGNILIMNGSLAALIDFGDVTSGDPAYDLAAGWLLFDHAGRSAFREATAGRYDDDTWVRARAWAAYLAAVFLTESDDRPALRALGERAAGELTSS
ncbi:hypothetical protein AUC47_07250 [Microbacterium sp. SZ1]|uniref:aminoglycoside phosphotransferase family protein n=1 Tax=Microbacterium sp. SZ1 TaxID=1849736 RepID=UPI000BBBF896|nr:aminoglycoside phosphotransferase family protein [Microbacterium sp. SZ1]PCE13600.1 hypothetical protein AUC47_07250 [Microbacterium sp. SZ1]